MFHVKRSADRHPLAAARAPDEHGVRSCPRIDSVRAKRGCDSPMTVPTPSIPFESSSATLGCVDEHRAATVRMADPLPAQPPYPATRTCPVEARGRLWRCATNQRDRVALHDTPRRRLRSEALGFPSSRRVRNTPPPQGRAWGLRRRGENRAASEPKPPSSAFPIKAAAIDAHECTVHAGVSAVVPPERRTGERKNPAMLRRTFPDRNTSAIDAVWRTGDLLPYATSPPHSASRLRHCGTGGAPRRVSRETPPQSI
jgi:hypothetical protein